MAIIRTIMTVSVAKDLTMCQLDVNNAFLHEELDEEVYLEMPKGMPNPGNKVCRLRKPLYGVKQANR